MSIVHELQRDAYSSALPVSELLRKAMFVARKLQIQKLADWISKELNGYASEDRETLPKYRGVNGEVRAHNMVYGTVPVHFSDQSLQDVLCRQEIYVPVSELESMVSTLRQNPQAVYMREYLADEMNCIRQHLDISLPTRQPLMFVASVTQLEAILNSVRNVILDWSLKLEEDGIIGDGMSFTPEEKQAASTHNYQNCTIGALQSGNNNSANITQTISSDAIEALRQARILLNQLPETDRLQAIELLDTVEGDVVQNKWTTTTKACAKELLTSLQAAGSGIAIEYVKNRLEIQ